jgi:site-specific DNA-cytosine methylase
MSLKVVAVNSYAGSLVIGARARGHEVVASLEDEKGYGVDVQRMNFGGMFPIRAANPRYWRTDPSSNLSGHVVIAHPPCSAFSGQNNSAARRGVDSDAFDCTKKVLDFGMTLRADAVVVESVMGALAGAREVHDWYAQQHGYALYRLVLNAVSFGIPQERERFWAIFVRKPWAMREFFLEAPQLEKFPEVRDALSQPPYGDLDRTPASISRDLEKQLTKWYQSGLSDSDISDLLSGRRGFGMLNTKISGSSSAKAYQVFSFGTRNVRLLDPRGVATVLLSDSFWMVPSESPGSVLSGRVLFESEYKALMGFPRDYKFPFKYLDGKFREYLSKGVCPPIAGWVLDQVERNLEGLNDFGATHSIIPGGILALPRQGPFRVTSRPSEERENPPQYTPKGTPSDDSEGLEVTK